MGIHYSSYKSLIIVKKKNIKEFYNLIENSNHGINVMDENYKVVRYNPFLYQLCGLTRPEMKLIVGNSPISNNKPGGQGILVAYQPHFTRTAGAMVKEIIVEINKNYTTETVFLLQNKKNPENIFFAKSYIRRVQVGKQTLTLASFFPIKETPFIDPLHSENEETIKKIKSKKSKKSKKKNKINTKEKKTERKRKNHTKENKKAYFSNFNNPFHLANHSNLNPKEKCEPSIIELDSDSDLDQNNSPLNSLNDTENSNYTDDDEENSYDSWVEPLTDFENEPQKNSFIQNQNQNLNQTNNIQKQDQIQDQMVFLTNAFVMSKLIERNYSNSNSSSRKNSKVFPKELNSKTGSFKGGSFNNIKKKRKNRKTKKSNKKNTNKRKTKSKAQGKTTKSKNNKTKKNKKNKTKSNQKNIKINNVIINNTSININHNIYNTTINKNNNNTTINKNITNIINNSNTVKNTRNNDSLHINPNNNKNITNYNKIDNNNNNKIHANTNINKNNLNENAIFNDKNEIENTKGTINNNIFKNSTTVGNTIYKFVINEDQKPETDLENILPCSKEIDNIFQDYESEK
ncbi:hypothetical protein M0812_28508 [Anaeramoeba flamelloides]|uniref:PAS domain-containing protein n=1 Tax=Anaeramoeba flamelloides TaxID=1746091 RepID=A0AAV7YBV2_9EUKA|nr:hypothetical protein M0812_28508 [Anaeramoeba flamelloides]